MAHRWRWASLGILLRALRGSLRPDEPSVSQRVRALPRLVRDTVLGRYRGTTMGRLALMAAAAVYVVSPVDLLPELPLGLLGLLDDSVVLTWLAATVLSETADFLTWERSGGRRRHPDVVVGQVLR